jgi:hypothetical protein
MKTNEATIGDNGGPSMATSEKIEDLLEATLDATLKRVRAGDVNGTDITAAVKVLKEVGVLKALADLPARNAHTKAMQQQLDDLPDCDEHGQIIDLPSNRPSR